MKNQKKKHNQKGQALIALLFFVMMALAIATAATFIVAANSQSGSDLQEGVIARQMADSGIETALLALLRNSSYSGESLSLNGGQVVISVTGTTTKIIDATATNGNFTKRVEITATYSNNVLTPNPGSWKEVN